MIAMRRDQRAWRYSVTKPPGCPVWLIVRSWKGVEEVSPSWPSWPATLATVGGIKAGRVHVGWTTLARALERAKEAA